jgi:hypothetical protein
MIRSALSVSLFVMTISASAVGWADCRHAHKAYREGEVACVNGFQFHCAALGSWKKTADHCDARASTPQHNSRPESPPPQSSLPQSPSAPPKPASP